MARQDPVLDRVRLALAEVPNFRTRALFGGWGLYAGTTFFGIVYRGRLFLWTSPTTRTRYTVLGMGPFRPNPDQTLWDYYEVPPAVIDGDDLRFLAEEAIVARRDDSG